MRNFFLVILVLPLLLCNKSATAPDKMDSIEGSWKLAAEIKSIYYMDTLVKSEIYYSDSTDIHYIFITEDSLFIYDYYSGGNGFRLRNECSYLRGNGDTLQPYTTIHINFKDFEFSETDWQITSTSTERETLFIDKYWIFEPYSVEPDSINFMNVTDSIWKRFIYISNVSAGLPNIDENLCSHSCFSGILIDLDSYTDSFAVETLNVEIYDTIKMIGVSEIVNHWQVLNMGNPVRPPDYEVYEIRDTIGDSIHYFFNFIPMTKTDEDILFFRNEDQKIFNSDSNSLEAEVIIIVRLNVD